MNNAAMTVVLTSILSLLFFAYAIFAYRYARYSPWNATWQGVTLLSQKITMAALVGFFVVDTLAPNSYAGRYSLLVILLTLLLVEGWATLAGLLHVQRKGENITARQGIGYRDSRDIQSSDTLVEEERNDDDEHERHN